MALSVHDAFSAGRRSRRRRGRRAAQSEINVTPLVDVMLVLLIIFMISAPLLTAGVPVELPKTEAGALSEQTEPLSITIRKDGAIFVQEKETPFVQLGPQMRALSKAGYDKPVFVRADGQAAYEVVARVMASLSTSGFHQIGLITDTGGPSSGAKPPEKSAIPALRPSAGGAP
jgi:biopolymer transport protein TolR